MKNLPKNVFLNIGTEEATDFNELHEVTWCQDQIYKSDLKYISVDFLSRRIEEINQELEDIEGYGMSAGQKRNRLRGIKKELKNLIKL